MNQCIIGICGDCGTVGGCDVDEDIGMENIKKIRAEYGNVAMFITAGKLHLGFNSTRDTFDASVDATFRLNVDPKYADQQLNFADESMRTLAFAYKKISKEELEKALENHPEKDVEFFNEIAQGATFGIMIGIRDNNRPDVPNAIAKCHHAGITVRMVTGDNIVTATAIAKDCGTNNNGHCIINESIVIRTCSF